jgi:hypothetical protein
MRQEPRELPEQVVMQEELRRFGAVSRDLPSVMALFEVGPAEVHRVLNRLFDAGYICWDPDRPDTLCWIRTPEGTALAEAPLIQPLTRGHADRILDQVVRRVAEVNRRPYFLCRVTAVGVFGEYLTDAPLLADLDVVLRLVPKESVPGESHEVRKTHRRLPYWRLQRLLPESEWPQWRERHVELYLAKGLRNLVLHRFETTPLQGRRVQLLFLGEPR